MMRHFYYTIQTLLHERGVNIIKIISMTLGIFVGILLFSCVAFQLSYYNFCPQSEQLYVTYMDGPFTYGPFSAAMRENFPKEVEDATILRDMGTNVFYNGNVRLTESTIYADEHLFSTLGLKLLIGKAEELTRPDVLFISRSLAEKIREGNSLESVIGKTLSVDRKEPMSIRGVFEDMGENADIHFDVVVPMSKLWNLARGGWGYDISYMSIIRFRDPAKDIKAVEARIPDMLKKYMADSSNKKKSHRFSFRPLLEYHTADPTVRLMILMMSVLGIAILLIAAFDYVLIAVSSLARRAKSIGVHKCCGATDNSIFRMFLTETALVLFISVLLTMLLIFQFREFVEEIAGIRLSSLFTWQTLWVPLTVLLVVFILAGAIPASIFASIPVTQVFRRYAERKTSWKRPLLFIQFAGMTFILGFLMVVFCQYHMAMNKDLGYNPERVVMGWKKLGSNRQNAKSFFMNLPMVEEHGVGQQAIWRSWSGEVFNVGEGRTIKGRFEWIGDDFVPMMKIQILHGKNVTSPKEALVNEEFVRRAGWTDEPIGKQLSIWGKEVTIVGVMKNFSVQSVYHPQYPVLLLGSGSDSNPGLHYVRLKEPFDEILEQCCIPRPKGGTVFTKEEAIKTANEIGYPVLIRPSYVLGGQGMQIAISDEDISEFMDVIQRYAQEHPILIDKYLMGVEVEVDAVCDGEEIVIPGIMQHVERAGIHSGDSISVYPARDLSPKIKKVIGHYTKLLAKALHVIGLINIQFIVYQDEVYVIEVNPRSSRTVPYISKVTGIPIVDLATKVMTGMKLKDLGYEPGLQPESPYWAIKMPVFSFEKIRGADISLGPEMKSTGECLGISKNFEEALFKAFLGSGVDLPKHKKMIMTVKDSDKLDAVEVGKRFTALGYEIYATRNTCKTLQESGVPAKRVNKIEESHPNLLDLILGHQIDLIIDTPSQGIERSKDGFVIRRHAVETGVNCLTSLDTANALLTSLESSCREDLSLVDIAEIDKEIESKINEA